MWVFASRLPRSAILIAPRGPFVSKHPELAGYSWVPERGESFSSLPMFQPALDSFEKLFPELAAQLSTEITEFSLMGFSQGAAFSFAYAMRNPRRVSKLAALSGFLPAENGSRLASLATIPIFVAHGTKDETVPVAMARDARVDLEAAGAAVHYCESETGHKLGANCAAELQAFFSI